MSLREVRLQGFVPARYLILRLQFEPHLSIRMHFCQQRVQLAEAIGFPTHSFSPAPRSELIPHPLAFAFPTIEHPNPDSFVLAPGEDIRTFNPLLRDEVQFAVCVALRRTRDRSLLGSTSHLSFFPLHPFCFKELGTILWELTGCGAFIGLDSPVAARVAALR